MSEKQMLTPHLVLRDAVSTMALYKKAFGAEELCVALEPDSGKVMHATMKIGNSEIQISDEFPQMGAVAPAALGGTAVTLNLDFATADKVDAAWKRAVDAGLRIAMPLANQFWGGRYGIVEDASGHRWAFHAHVENPSPEEVAKRAAAAMKSKA